MATTLIDCVTHALTGPAILRAAGINKDGTINNPDSVGYPQPCLLFMRVGQSRDKINTIRVAISSESKQHHRGRMFEILFNDPIQSRWKFGLYNGEIEIVGMYFGPGGMKHRTNLAIDKLFPKGFQL